MNMRTFHIGILVWCLGYSFSGHCAATVTVIDTFLPCSAGTAALPCEWKPSRRATGMFSLHLTPADRFISVSSRNDCTSLARPVTLDTTYGFLKWKWRVWQLPPLAREDKKNLNDSGAGVYVIFKARPPFNDIIKYVWSTTLPVGTSIASPYRNNSKVVVLESGIGRLGQWIGETVDVRNDYQRLFGSAAPLIQAIGILTDSDNTHSIARADYGPFFAERK